MDRKLTIDEHKKTYLTKRYCKMRSNKYKSVTIENFLSDDELDAFDAASKLDNITYLHDTSMYPQQKRYQLESDTTAHYHKFDKFYTDPAWAHLVDIIQPKLAAQFGSKIKASHIHILDSRFPYGLHNDAEQENYQSSPNPAWTLIIPLDDYESKTYVFNESSVKKDPREWIKQYKIQPNTEPAVDKKTWEKDFAPFTDFDLLHYLTVETTFKWKRGSCFAADRYKFHCSDNFINYGLEGKRAIIIWTGR